MKLASHGRTNSVLYHLYDVSKLVKPEGGNKMVVAMGWGQCVEWGVAIQQV